MPSRPLQAISLVCILIALCIATACGGGSGGSGGGGGGGGVPDFSISIRPATVVVGQGGSVSTTVSITAVNGFGSQVSVGLSGIPVNVTASPSSFTVTATSSQVVTFSAASNATLGVATVAVSGTSSQTTHSSNLTLGVDSVATGMHPPSRTRYLRTDAQWDYSFINFFPQRWIIYDSASKRFFANNTTQNRIDVFDATTELQVGEIAVPQPWLSDETSDHSIIYVGTFLGDLYAIDPVKMKVTKRVPSVEIGPTGFQAYQVHVMSNGRLALLGSTGGIPAVDGFAQLGVWSPLDNSLTFLRGGPPGTGVACDQMGNIAEMTLNADRTKILVSSADSDGTLCLIDPDTLTYRATAFVGSFLPPALVTPDGKAIILAGGSTVNVFDAQGLFLTDTFQVGGGSGSFRYALSFDGNTLYATGTPGLAYNWKTHQQTGWVAGFTTGDLESSTTPQVVDETGLIAGVIGNGVSFLDGGALLSGAPGTQVPNPSVRPTSGSTSGGTQTTIVSAVSASRLKQVFFGTGIAEGATVDNLGIHVPSPPGTPGPVDVAVTSADGAFELSPEGFSYGPWIVETAPDSATAEGGGTATIYGYGFGAFGQGQQAQGLQVTVGGQPATIVQYLPTLATAALDPYYPFPLEGIVVTVPPGTAGTAVDITVTNPEGSYTAKKAFSYYSPVQQFPLPGAALIQGVYDNHRDVYYLTDQTQVRVFSRSQSQWLPSIPIPNASRLWGIALSPDGSKLVISDAAANVIYLLNPASLSNVTTFSLPDTGMDQGGEPAGLVVTNSGIIYYVSFYALSTGGWAFHKLNSSTGTVTDYQWLQGTGLAHDAYARVLMSADNARVYVNDGGTPVVLDTATDTTYSNSIVTLEGDYEMTLSSNGTWMTASEFLTDTNLNPISFPAYAERETWNVAAVFGQKLSPDGSLLFSPLQNAIDILDGKRGTLVTRVSLPFSMSSDYDALVANGQDNVLVAIMGNGTGLAVIDFNFVAEPLPLPYVANAPNSRLVLFVHDHVPINDRRMPPADGVSRKKQLRMQHVFQSSLFSRPSR